MSSTGISSNKRRLKRVVAFDIVRAKLIEILDILKKTNYVFQYPKIEDEDGELFKAHVEAFLRKIFKGYDLKSEDEKKFFRLAEVVRSLTALMSDRKTN
ncbi:MAG: hypothetical protein COV02_01660 [Candidatus Terrybacteria bacterium CG10_big_fil_rev_8_21_14_0_10_41_10]|uniref:Uncharacterized protein n=1 Tax=Candidatus Terrybacteria bacterium CG10_big_fil_rev_8_21_14_0_10_41_10 TaxID=1975026 RepID=A0A2M8LAJ5_9BACT|nr:MAG: hypothetical protein COV02_01660 [Candidatus Terrybacteria bacterium CG10_big_fil_rev_8_21_14_0_10_41_10]